MFRFMRLIVLIYLAGLLSSCVYAADIANDGVSGDSGTPAMMGEKVNMEDTEEAPGVFSGSVAESAWTLISFGILVFVLYKLAWGPLLRGLKAREDAIAADISAAEQAKIKARETLEEYERTLAEADEQSRKMAAKKLAEAEKKASKIIEEAREKTFELKKQARQDIDKARNSAQSELAREAGEMVFELGSNILGRTISPEDNERLIKEAIEIYEQKRNAKATG